MSDDHPFHLAAQLAAKQISSRELAQTYLDRIAALNPAINAFITVDAEKTLVEAAAADALIAAGNAGPLTGVPIAHKDIFCTDGWLTTCGSKMLHNFVAPYDAHVIQRFKAAGMPSSGQDQHGRVRHGLVATKPRFFGAVKNPWNPAYVPGGSSGGAAACVAARMAPAATGTDTGGSIRQPAALCGITGLKPTYGLVSRYGMIAFASSLDQAGPMAPSAEDCALLLNVMTGFDPNDSTSLEREKEDYTRDLEQPLAGLRVGLPKEFFAEGLNNEVAAAVEAAVAELKKLGATTVEISLANSQARHSRLLRAGAGRGLVATCRASTACATATAHRNTADLNDMYSKTRAQGFGAEVKRRILIGAYVLSHGYYDAYYLQAQKIRRLIADDFSAAFKTCDVILGPTAPGTAFKLGEKSDDPVEMYLNDLYTIPANLAGLPGMSLALRLRRQGPADRPAARRQLFQRGENAQRRPSVPARDRLAQPRNRRV